MSIWAILAIAVPLWIMSGIIGSGIMKSWFIEKFHVAGNMSEEEAWGAEEKAVGSLFILMGVLNLGISLFFILFEGKETFDGKPFKRFGFRI